MRIDIKPPFQFNPEDDWCKAAIDFSGSLVDDRQTRHRNLMGYPAYFPEPFYQGDNALHHYETYKRMMVNYVDLFKSSMDESKCVVIIKRGEGDNLEDCSLWRAHHMKCITFLTLS